MRKGLKVISNENLNYHLHKVHKGMFGLFITQDKFKSKSVKINWQRTKAVPDSHPVIYEIYIFSCFYHFRWSWKY